MHLVSYDISSNPMRNRLARYLARFGQRLQKSVFLVDVPRYQYQKFVNGIEKITDREGDVLIFNLCRGCQKNARQLAPHQEPFFIA